MAAHRQWSWERHRSRMVLIESGLRTTVSMPIPVSPDPFNRSLIAALVVSAPDLQHALDGLLRCVETGTIVEARVREARWALAKSLGNVSPGGLVVGWGRTSDDG